jgi:tetratricopeptide (TPR) repeat protein
MEIISIYRRFLEVYEELYGKEHLKTLHINHGLIAGCYNLCRLYHQANREIDAIEAWKICLQICDSLWTSPPEGLVFEYCVHGWKNLSCSNDFLDRYLESSKAARRALNLAGDYPELLEHTSISIEDLQKSLVKACGHLWNYGPTFHLMTVH